MDLKTFIAETLCQIQEGVEDAIRRRTDSGGGGAINPDDSKFEQDVTKLAKAVEFDVAVTVSEGEQKGGKGGLRVAGIGFGVDASDTKNMETISRVRFVVPVVVPTTKIARDRSEHVSRLNAPRTTGIY